ncbi:hypothetical protein MU480_14470, partial [Staphylococcus aureus]|nr:hypothetical protein [Staphylococcus aureus]
NQRVMRAAVGERIRRYIQDPHNMRMSEIERGALSEEFHGQNPCFIYGELKKEKPRGKPQGFGER